MISVFAFALLFISQPVFSQEPAGWRDRFQTPRRWVVAWADKAPQKILFTTNQSGIYQLYFYDLDKKNVLQLTEGSIDRDHGVLSPDGKEALYFKGGDKKDLGQIYRVSWKKELREEKLIANFPDQAIGSIHWGASGKSIYFAGSDGTGFGIYRFRLKEKAPVAIFKSTAAITAILPSWDEKYVAYSLGSDVYVLDLRLGKAAPVLSGGSYAAWAKEGDLSRLLVTGNNELLTRAGVFNAKKAVMQWLDLNLQGDIVAEDWLAGGKEVLLRQVDQAQTYLWRHDLNTQSTTLILSPNGYIAKALSRKGELLWLDFESSQYPRNFVTWDPGSSNMQTFLPDVQGAQPGFESYTGYPSKSVKFKSWDGTKIQGWLMKPGEGDRASKRSAIIYLHDKLQNFASNRWNPELLVYVDNGYVVLSLNYRGSLSFGGKFANEVIGNPGKKELEDINAAREYLINEANVAQEKIIVAGELYGGYLVLMSLTRYPHLWAAGFSLDGVADWRLLYKDASQPVKEWVERIFQGTPEEKADLYFERSPIAEIEKIRAPVLIIQNVQDTRIPGRQIDDFVSNLEELNKKYRYVTFSSKSVNLGVAEHVKFTEDVLNFLHELGLGPAPI